jgi:hypothetical protein
MTTAAAALTASRGAFASRENNSPPATSTVAPNMPDAAERVRTLIVARSSVLMPGSVLRRRSFQATVTVPSPATATSGKRAIRGTPMAGGTNEST